LFRVSYVRSSLALSVLFGSAAASAQTPPSVAPASSQDEDLEVPAAGTPATTPTSTVPAPVTSPSPAASNQQALAEAPVPATPRPAAAATAPATPAPASSEQPVNLEARAYTRPIPDGLKIGGYLQSQFQHNALSEDQLQQSGAPLNQNEFLVRRARLRLDRGWSFASATLELDANTVRGPKVGIRRAEASLIYRGPNPRDQPPLVMLSVGVLDIPFGFELAESARVRWFMERSIGSGALYPTEMDAGAKVSGAVAFLRYAVAVTNGEPVDESALPRDPNSNKEVTGRFGAEVAVSDHVELSGGSSFAVGKGFHAGQAGTKSRLIWNDVNQDGIAQQGEVVGVPGSAATPSENFERWAIGLDFEAGLQTSLGRSRLAAEAFVGSNHDRGFAPSDPVQTTLDARQAGGYVALTQELTRYGVVGFRAAIYDPNADVLETRGAKALPKTQTVKTFSPLAGLVLPNRARLLFQYDFVRDYLARDSVGVPTDAKNDQWTLRLQVEL
jgi:hypothetical protein